MREYTNKISLVKNKRGVRDLDPFKGCYYGTLFNKSGCYGICYAAKIAKFRGYDFSKVVYRYFEDEEHVKSIGKQLECIEFVRLGTMCDPSHDRDHTISIINKIKPYIKNIVVITKHRKQIKDEQLKYLEGICINTSVSALDNVLLRKYRLYQYNRLKPFCNSVLRVNTLNFNNNLFYDRKDIQDDLLGNEKVLDNIIRIPKSKDISKFGLINVGKEHFLHSEVQASIYNKNTHFGFCNECIEKCGIGLF